MGIISGLRSFRGHAINLGIISGSGSFRGRDHFGGCTVLCEGSPCLFPFIFTGQLGITGKKV